MTKQKFYEKVILKSFEHYCGTVLESEVSTLQNMMNWPPESFDELMLKRSICGFKTEIPLKHPFAKLGFEYLAQIIGFVSRTYDNELTCDFFDFLEKVKTDKKIIDLSNEEHVGVLYDSFYDTFAGEASYSDFAEKMADFILLNCKGSSYHKNVLTLAYATGKTNLGFSDLLKMKNSSK